MPAIPLPVLPVNISQNKYMFYCASPTSETCLFVSQLAVNSISYSVNEYSSEYFTRNRCQSNSSPIPALCKVTLLRYFNEKSLLPCFWHFLLFSKCFNKSTSHFYVVLMSAFNTSAVISTMPLLSRLSSSIALF